MTAVHGFAIFPTAIGICAIAWLSARGGALAKLRMLAKEGARPLGTAPLFDELGGSAGRAWRFGLSTPLGA